MLGSRTLRAVGMCALLVWTAGRAHAATIEGTVYDAATGQPVRGVALDLYFDSADAEAGQQVPASMLGAGQQGQVVGPGGAYRFDVPGGRVYRIAARAAATPYAAPSSRLPPADGFAPLGDVVPDATPAATGERRYYLRFRIDDDGDAVRNNHIAVDHLTEAVSLVAVADRPEASVGDVVHYTLTADNRSGRDLTGAAGRPVYLLDAPARGFDYVPRRVIATLTEAGGRRTVAAGETLSPRLVRFGPFDLPAGATLTVRYQVVVGLDTRPGRFENRAVLLDGGGVELSPPARAEVVVAPDRDLETGVVLGRVFCDSDGDGAFGRGDRGLAGARVYLDTGSYAVTDAAGLYHFSQVAPGTRLVKLDADSLAGGAPTSAEARVVRMTAGMPAQVGFAVRCAGQWVGAEAAEIILAGHPDEMSGAQDEPAPRPARRIVGDVARLHLEVDGQSVELPSAALELAIPDGMRAGPGDNLVRPPAGGYPESVALSPRWSMPDGVTAGSYTLEIHRVEPHGLVPVEGAGGIRGPGPFHFDGLDGHGAPLPDGLYVAQLVVKGDRRAAEAASAWRVFGIAHGLADQAPRVHTLDGRLVAGTAAKPVATAALTEALGAIAADLGPGDEVRIEAHWDGTGDRLSVLARTQREADLLAEILASAGVSADQVIARGRGSLEPVAAPRTAAARAQNRRLIVTVTPAPPPAAAVPATYDVAPAALVDGRPVPLDGDRFAARLYGSAAVIEVRAADGRRAAIAVGDGPSPAASTGAAQRAAAAPEPAAALAELSLTAGLFARNATPTEALRARLSRFAAVIAARPAGERYRVVVTVTTPDGTAADVALAVQARAAAIGSALDGLGVAGERYELVADAGAGDAIAFEIAAAAEAQVATAESAPPAGAPPASAAAQTAPVAAGETSRAAAPGPVRAADLSVHLPPRGASLPARELAITGRTDPQNRVLVGPVGGAAAEVRVGADGAFTAMVTLPVGPTEVRVQAIDSDGNTARIDWPLEVESSQLFVMALAEGVLSSAISGGGWQADSALLPGMTAGSTTTVGPVAVHGRATAYVKGRVDGGAVFDSVTFTAHVDTARRGGTGAFFEQVLDARGDFPVYGDSATEVRDVNTRGTIYAVIEADGSRASLGSIHTALEGGDLFRYERTVDGAALTIERTVGGHEIDGRAFATRGDVAHAGDVNWYRATGGSLYYLRHGHVLEGSETVRIVVRDRDSGMVLSERAAVRHRDYSVDYPGGRLLFVAPPASVARADGLIADFEASATPLDGHPVYVEVRYEHSDPRGARERAAGVYARETYAGLSVGAGVVGATRAGDDTYSLWGADLGYRAGPGTAVRAEIAGSRSRAVANVLSADGGLTFLDLDRAGDEEQGTQLGFKLTGEIAFGDLVDADLARRTRMALYVQSLDRGFSSADTVLEQGRLKLGGVLSHRLSARDRVSVRHHAQVAEHPRVGPTRADVDAAADPLALEERATYRTTATWARDDGLWHHRVEAAHLRYTSTAALADGGAAVDARRLGFAGGTAYQYSPRLTLRARQQLLVGLRDADPHLHPIDPDDSGLRRGDRLAGVTTGVGADVRLTEDVSLAGDWMQRWNGDSAAQLGLRSALSETGSVYVRERVASLGGRLSSTTIIGAEDQVAGAPGSRTYGEYQIEHGILGQRSRAVLGMGHRWRIQPGLRLSLGFEHQQVFGGFLPDGTPIGESQREVLFGGADFTGAETFKASAHVELRVDSGLGGRADPALVRDDPRDGVAPGAFPDHGGVAPGAPLVVGPGSRIQMVAGAGSAWTFAPDHTALGRVRLARTEDVSDAFTVARHLEATVGWAYRPVATDKVAVLSRYSFLADMRPVNTSFEQWQREDASWIDHRSHVLAVVPLAELPGGVTLGGKLALKHTHGSNHLTSGDAVDARVTALLGLARVGYRLYGRWDASGELRRLSLHRDGGGEALWGSLFELGYGVAAWVRLGFGYNFSHFSDDELGDLERDSHGLFIRITGHY